jgi:hypothetical protein
MIASNFMQNDGGKIKNIDGSAYALLQAVTQYVDHQRDGLRVGESTLEKVRAENAMFGTGNQFKNEALDRICEAVGIGEELELVGAGAGPTASRIDNLMSMLSVN